ncbi:hypothetical protein QAD02_002721 [Eretmocerus hayati]|uniref:Uncharacterized protein n=1 Tax=Eretmocerus hayati TaxID=131215 RepID=A0ACC2NK40_9HYME|nr:hypothetical protein QAD02_002721 [Eretmocerus hayati]
MSNRITSSDAGIVKEYESNLQSYKICFVPDCPNTTVTTPQKVFLSLPKNAAKHKLRREAVETPEKNAKKTKHCCEDHFDLQNDLENYWAWRLTGAKKRLSDGAIPRRSLNFEQIQSDVDTSQNEDAFLDGVSVLASSVLEDTVVDDSTKVRNEAAYQPHISRLKKSTSTPISFEHKHVQAKPTVCQKKTQTRFSAPPHPKTTVDRGTQYEIQAPAVRNLQKVTNAVKDLKVSDELNDTVESISSHEFGISGSQASRVFTNHVDTMAEFFKQLIIWPNRKQIKMNLPIPFRYRYSDVQSIIDCFEIEIEKPSDAMNQSMTWSQYKGCNTYKGFLSVTGDGLMNFVSKGACGRCSDISIVENCGYLDKIPPGTSVLADRGFKGLDILLQRKSCTLTRPPSVQKDIKSSKEDVKLTKQVASIRIHVERAINRIRNYSILDIHSRVDNSLIKHIDSLVYIVCGLVNLQRPIIKQTDD